MARATRSTTQNQEKEKDKQTDSASATALPLRPKATSKKRKRTSIPESDDQPAAKQSRTDVAIKDEGSPEPEGQLQKEHTSAQLQNAGEVPIDPVDAQKILDILEMCV